MSDDGNLGPLFAKERRAHPPSSAGQARVWSRLESSLNLGPTDPGGGGGESAPATPPPRIASRPTKLMAQLSMAACFIGAAGLLWSAYPSKNDAARPRVAARPETLPRIAETRGTAKVEVDPTPTIAVDALPSVGAPMKSIAKAARAAAESGEAPCTICEERAILDAGRRGLREKHYDLALAAIGEHQSRFAAGQLAEERESLRVHVLVAMGRTSEADLGKAAFRKSFPDSPLLESVERAGSR